MSYMLLKLYGPTLWLVHYPTHNPTPLPHLAYWLYAKWFLTKHKGGHAIASYVCLSMGICLKQTPFAALILSPSTTESCYSTAHNNKDHCQLEYPQPHVPQNVSLNEYKTNLNFGSFQSPKRIKIYLST